MQDTASIVCSFNEYSSPAIFQHRTYCYRIQIESAIFYPFVNLRSYRVQRQVCPAAPDKSRTGVIELPVGGNRELTVKASDELLYTGSG